MFTAGGGIEFLPRDKLQAQGGWSSMSTPGWGPPCPCSLSAITSSLAEEVLSPFSTYQNTCPQPGQLIGYILAGPPCLLCTSKLFWAPMLQYVLLPGHHTHPLSCAHLCTSNPQLPVPLSIWILTLRMDLSLHTLLLQVYVTAYVTCPQCCSETKTRSRPYMGPENASERENERD